eukprot:gnl/Trimastix_PCT/1576.p1 GENE.gnl/Trimastix_PCT/1576~~gnl/Trimastix_PCT/1576.p1  ORF type:complete len:410 (+),score=109.24 gnl/Trimastix_PCT/1576:745-1974(+)
MHILIFLFLLFSPTLATMDVQQIIIAIQQGAEYIRSVALDSTGRSRCDYDQIHGAWVDYEPAWHTGQLIHALCSAYEAIPKTEYLNAARHAGEWWLKLQMQSPPALKGMIRAIHTADIPYIVFATVTDGTPGLFHLANLTRDQRFADVPCQAGEWMLRHMKVPGEWMFYDCVDPKTGAVLTKHSPFHPHKLHQGINDVARPNNEGSLFLDMYEHTKDARYLEVFLRVCDALVAKQGPRGMWMDFMPNERSTGFFHPRFNLWYAESLLRAYEVTKNTSYYHAALRTARTMLHYQRADGTMFYKNYLRPTGTEGAKSDEGDADGGWTKYRRDSVCGSGVSFAALLWLRLIELGHPANEFINAIDRSLAWIVANMYPIDHPDPNLGGAFLETRVHFGNAQTHLRARALIHSH